MESEFFLCLCSMSYVCKAANLLAEKEQYPGCPAVNLSSFWVCNLRPSSGDLRVTQVALLRSGCFAKLPTPAQLSETDRTPCDR